MFRKPVRRAELTQVRLGILIETSEPYLLIASCLYTTSITGTYGV